MLLDLGLPDIDGLDVCRELRARGDVPLIILSGRGSETEKVVGLELGADDYLVKPFLTRELIARMRAVLRRHPAGPACRHLPPRDTYGRLSVDRRSHREAIMASVWDSNWFGPTKTLDTHVTALRHKLGGALRIQAVRGVGFRPAVEPPSRAGRDRFRV